MAYSAVFVSAILEKYPSLRNETISSWFGLLVSENLLNDWQKRKRKENDFPRKITPALVIANYRIASLIFKKKITNTSRDESLKLSNN